MTDIKEIVLNFIAMIIATAVWCSGFGALLTLYFVFSERDFFYLSVSGALAVFATLGVIATRYSKRLKVAVEYPFIFF
jgi:hypothetical protein